MDQIFSFDPSITKAATTHSISVLEGQAMVLETIRVEYELPHHEDALKIWTMLTPEEKVDLVARVLP